MKIPAQRLPEPVDSDQPSPEPAPVAGNFYSAVVLQAGCNQPGEMFRTYQAVVTVQTRGDGQC